MWLAYYVKSADSVSTLVGVSDPLTIVAGAFTDANGDNVGGAIVDTLGAYEVKVLVSAVSAGNVDVWAEAI